ncbi:MAG: ABC transporter ATP-binding protein [Oligosphaeraceae bacterium]|nr:ABC transporter ATP-binding protein [Oligosphaeraceae bacterium]
MFGKKEHFRGYQYRPPLQRPETGGKDWPLYFRFIKQYAWPFRYSLIVCMLLVAINSNYVYVISYLSRLVVDNILVIGGEREDDAGQVRRSITAADRDSGRSPSRPVVSMGEKIDMGLRAPQRPPEAGRKLFILAVFYMLTQLFFNTLGRLAARRHIVVAQGIMGSLREDMHKKVMELSMSYHQAMSPGRLMSRILSDVESVQLEMMALLISGTHCCSMILVGGIILFATDWRMACIALTIMPIYSWMYHNKRPQIRHYNQELRHTNACLYGLVTQKIDAIKAIQAYAREPGEELAFHRLVACFFRDALKVQFISSVLGCQAGILAHLCNCGIFLFGGWLVLHGKMSLGKMIFVQSATITLFQPVLEFTQLNFVLQRMRISLLRVAGVLDREVEIVEDPSSVLFPRPIRQGIEVRNLGFTYPSSKIRREADESDTNEISAPEPVLHDISFKVPAGTWLCIMGASGSGKTTLLHLLSRIYEPNHGEILIDGINLQKINLQSLRRSLGVVPQEAQIFSGSMKENICYGFPEASNEQIMAAAKAAQMHDFIMEMKTQYETIIGQKGASLSGGQRQRLSLARALLTEPELLILDDCTSALDANTERKIQETLGEILQGKTAIMVSQRVSMAMRCHKILVLEDGHVKEFGSHRELLQNNGFYAKLHFQQTE